MKNLTWQNPEQLFVAQELINKVKSKCCGIKDDIKCDREFTLLWSPPEKFAGGARNKGIESAVGKWLIFADADDYFAKNAFNVFDTYLDSDADIIYFCAQGVYEDGTLSTRGEQYKSLVEDYLQNPQTEYELRTKFSVPWAKMVRRDFVSKHVVLFDEVLAANDAFFSLKSGFFANKVDANNHVVYIVTTNKGSLTKRKDLAAIQSRYMVGLRKNKFLREHGRPDLQLSLMVYLFDAIQIGVKPFLSFLWLAVKYRQNLMIGITRWYGSYKTKKRKESDDKQYYTK